MKLFDPENANGFVFAVVSIAAKEGTPPDFRCIAGGDIEACLRSIDAAKLRNAYPHCMGRYDELGRYCTYKPPIEDVTPGKFQLHPVAQIEYEDYRQQRGY